MFKKVFHFLVNVLCVVSVVISCTTSHNETNKGTDTLHRNGLHSSRQFLYIDNSAGPPIVHTKYGSVEGYKMASVTRKVIYAYEGIPFAETTGGENRFKLAVPKAPWNGTLPAKTPGPSCIQLHLLKLNRLQGSEDCLSVNVYSSANPNSGTGEKPLLPVIVYIHGGAFSFSSGSEYGPAYLLEEDLVFVTFNYRLALFGYLSVDDKSVMPDNLGFKDQALALKWVHENIEYFGGDRDRIVISGLSSGATSVHLHYMSNLTKDYFAGGISFSGSAFTPATVMTKTKIGHINGRLAFLTNCPNPHEGNNSAAYIECLRKIDANTLARLNSDLFDLRMVRFGAVIEDSRIPGAFLVEHPDDVYINKRIARKPWISTRTRDEGQCFPIGLQVTGVEPYLTFAFSMLTQPVIRFFNRTAPTILDFGYINESEKSATVKKILDFYLGDGPPYRLTNVTVFGDILSDRSFLYPLKKALSYHSQFAPTYSYLYDYKAVKSILVLVGMHVPNRKKYGVCHADDISSFVNVTTHVDNYRATDKDFAVIQFMANLFKNFALKGKPVYTDSSGHDIELWKPITNPHDLQFLNINEEISMIPEPSNEKGRLQFWENIGLEDSKPWKIVNA